MKLRIRRGTMADADECGRIRYEAFTSIAERHNFTADFPSVEKWPNATCMSFPGLKHPVLKHPEAWYRSDVVLPPVLKFLERP